MNDQTSVDPRLEACLSNWDGILPDAYANLVDEERKRLINRVNTQVNQVAFKKERRDYWKNPSEFFHDRGGDCEDFVIVKGVILHRLIPNLELKLVICRMIGYLRRVHAVLCVVLPDGEVMYLDNLYHAYGADTFVEYYEEIKRTEWPA